MSLTRIRKTGEPRITPASHGRLTISVPIQIKLKSLREIDSKERVDSSYVSRMVNLTTLAPDVVAAILDETLHADLTLLELAVDPPALRAEQRNGRLFCLGQLARVMPRADLHRDPSSPPGIADPGSSSP